MSVGIEPEAIPRKRPLGVTFLSLLLAWLTLAALANSVVFPLSIEGWPVYLTLLSLAYALTAGATSVGLWRMKPWALATFKAWGVVLLLLMGVFFFLFQVPQRLQQHPLEEGILFIATTGTIVLVYWLMYRYIRRRVFLRP